MVLDGLYNFHWVTDGVGRSAQPYLGLYEAFLRGHGIKSVVNLRGDNPKHKWWHQERAVCQKLGIAHFDVKLDTRRLPSPDRLASLFDAFARAEKPLLLKCSGGQDRTSLAAALYLLDAGAPLQTALAQFAPWPYLHRPRVQQLWMYALPAYAREQAQGQPLQHWVRGYDSQHFAEWLRSHRMGGSFQGLQRPAPKAA